ncbi:hypothetical protein Acj133p234 [Acinetobacter phage 133]|uniref:Uncharacterized protein n=1 Tax=Acinetobacter phage 133 TaxID=2919552 RepID=D9I6G8_9CAUD|nr:hypothetical protein Acj133p234 [Acinetobacter phage 133]ADJ19549.1 hypothetical protein Acj133p234 [Acinetobacter phage 133]
MTKIYSVGQIYRLTPKWSDAYTNRSLTAAYKCLQEGEVFEVLEVGPRNQKVTKAKHKSTGTVITHDMLFAASDLDEYRLELMIETLDLSGVPMVEPGLTCIAKAPSTDVAINASKELQTIALEQDGKIITLAGVQITQLKSILDRMVEK